MTEPFISQKIKILIKDCRYYFKTKPITVITITVYILVSYPENLP